MYVIEKHASLVLRLPRRCFAIMGPAGKKFFGSQCLFCSTILDATEKKKVEKEKETIGRKRGNKIREKN
jgi:hypothetical protein